MLGFKKKRQEPPRRRNPQHTLENESNLFRRSATLTGTKSEKFQSANEERGQLQSARLEAQAKRKKRNKRLRQAAVVCLLLLLVATVLLNRIRSYDIVVNDVQRQPATAEYNISAQQFSANHLKNLFVFSLDAEALAEYLMTRHREIKAITVEKTLFNQSPKLTVVMRQPVLKWQTTQDRDPFYVDAEGVGFTFNAYAKEEELVQVSDESGVPAELGAPVASSRQIQFLGRFIGEVDTNSNHTLTVTGITFPPESTKQINVHLADRPYFVKAYLDRAARAQAEQLVKSVRHIEANGEEVKEYFDVRVAERTYYK